MILDVHMPLISLLDGKNIDPQNMMLIDSIMTLPGILWKGSLVLKALNLW